VSWSTTQKPLYIWPCHYSSQYLFACGKYHIYAYDKRKNYLKVLEIPVDGTEVAFAYDNMIYFDSPFGKRIVVQSNKYFIETLDLPFPSLPELNRTLTPSKWIQIWKTPTDQKYILTLFHLQDSSFHSVEFELPGPLPQTWRIHDSKHCLLIITDVGNVFFQMKNSSFKVVETTIVFQQSSYHTSLLHDNILWLSSKDYAVDLFRPQHPIPHNYGPVTFLSRSSNGILSMHKNIENKQTIVWWDGKTGNPRFSLTPTAQVSQLKNNAFVLCFNQNSETAFYDLKTGKLLHCMPGTVIMLSNDAVVLKNEQEEKILHNFAQEIRVIELD
jgi:hypothetical protein